MTATLLWKPWSCLALLHHHLCILDSAGLTISSHAQSSHILLPKHAEQEKHSCMHQHTGSKTA